MNRTEHELELMRRYLEGMASLEETQELESLIVKDASVRQDFLRYTHLDSALAGVRRSQPPVVAPCRAVWLSWRPLTAAAAGIVFGMFCTSLVWAVAGTRVQPLQKITLPLENADFERNEPLLSGGVPVECGFWSGDYAESTTGENGIQPKVGNRMFRFMRSDSSLASDAQSSHTGNMYQAVDMRRYRAELADGQARLDWSACFQWVPAANEKIMSFAVSVWTFTGDPSILPANWRDHLYRETAKSGSRKAFEDSPRQWREMKGSMIIPPDTDFLVIELKAIPQEQPPGAEPYRFAGCYADDVRLILNTAGTPSGSALNLQ